MGNFTPTKWKLKDLLSDIDCGKLRLPSFQRDYKWTAPKVKRLLDSIQCVVLCQDLVQNKMRGSAS